MGKAVSISVSERQRDILELWKKNRAGMSAQLIERCSLILLAADGVSDTDQGRRLESIEAGATLADPVDGEPGSTRGGGARGGHHDLLIDEYRSGTPPTFSAEAGRRLRRFLVTEILPKLVRGVGIDASSLDARRAQLAKWAFQEWVTKAEALRRVVEARRASGEIDRVELAAWLAYVAYVVHGSDIPLLRGPIPSDWSTPRQIGLRLGVTARRVGRIITRLGLRQSRGCSSATAVRSRRGCTRRTRRRSSPSRWSGHDGDVPRSRHRGVRPSRPPAPGAPRAPGVAHLREPGGRGLAVHREAGPHDGSRRAHGASRAEAAAGPRGARKSSSDQARRPGAPVQDIHNGRVGRSGAVRRAGVVRPGGPTTRSREQVQ